MIFQNKLKATNTPMHPTLEPMKGEFSSFTYFQKYFIFIEKNPIHSPFCIRLSTDERISPDSSGLSQVSCVERLVFKNSKNSSKNILILKESSEWRPTISNNIFNLYSLFSIFFLFQGHKGPDTRQNEHHYAVIGRHKSYEYKSNPKE